MTLAFLMEVIMKKLVLLGIALLAMNSQSIVAVNTGQVQAVNAEHELIDITSMRQLANPRAYDVPQRIIHPDSFLAKNKQNLVRSAQVLSYGFMFSFIIESNDWVNANCSFLGKRFLLLGAAAVMSLIQFTGIELADRL